MSQYPSPYNAPTPAQYGGYQPWPNLLAPARRAGWLMISMGSITLLCGMCVGAVAFALPTMLAQMPAEQSEPIRRMETEFHVSAQVLFVVLAVGSTIIAILFVGLGIFTRGGKLGWLIASLVMTSLSLIYFVINMVVAAFSGSGGLGAVCFSALLVGVLILLLIWLIQAMRASARMKQITAQYEGGYWPQAYPQVGYGGYDPAAYQQGWYPPPPPPPPPPTTQRPPDKQD